MQKNVDFVKQHLKIKGPMFVQKLNVSELLLNAAKNSQSADMLAMVIIMNKNVLLV